MFKKIIRCDITVVLSGQSVSSTSKWDPVWVCKQWPELYESGRFLSWETVPGLTIVEWDVASIVRVGEDSYLGICEKPLGQNCYTMYETENKLLFSQRWTSENDNSS